MKALNVILLNLLVFVLCISCQQKNTVDIAKLEQEILEVHNLSRTYHVEKMVEEFVAQQSEKFMSVSNGNIAKPTKESVVKRFTNYFNNVEFEKWDDVNPPIIRFSNDYSMAYTLVDKEVILTYVNDENQKARESTKFAWVAIYTKQNGEWKVDCVASTNKPSVEDIIE